MSTAYVYFYRLTYRRAGMPHDVAGTYTTHTMIDGGVRFDDFVSFMADRYRVGNAAIRVESLSFLHQIPWTGDQS